MNQEELDSVLGAVENPIRRRIIAKLSEEPNYQLQLSKELGVSQQLIAKHLSSMEGAGLVSTLIEDSPRGPQRKEYVLSKSFSVTIDMAPSLFKARLFTFGMEEGMLTAQMAGNASGLLRYPDEAARIGPLAEIISEIDKRVQEVEDQRAVLLYLRSVAFREIARATSSLVASDRKKVLHSLMSEGTDSLKEMSASLGLGQQALQEILEEIEREFARHG